MFEGQRSAASIGIESRNERVGSMPKPTYAIQTIAKARRARLLRSPSPQRDQGGGKRRISNSGRGEQPVTANRTGTDFTQEDLGAG